MKIKFVAGYILSFLTVSLYVGSCKGRSSENTNSDTATTNTTAPADKTTTKNPDTMVVSGDDSLRNMITDALKDYPDVHATVDQGVITVTGNITREKLPRLMASLNSLHPKKINNNLAIK